MNSFGKELGSTHRLLSGTLAECANALHHMRIFKAPMAGSTALPWQQLHLRACARASVATSRGGSSTWARPQLPRSRPSNPLHSALIGPVHVASMATKLMLITLASKETASSQVLDETRWMHLQLLLRGAQHHLELLRGVQHHRLLLRGELHHLELLRGVRHHRLLLRGVSHHLELLRGAHHRRLLLRGALHQPLQRTLE